MSFKSESQLQELLIEILQKETILDLINGVEEIDDHLDRDKNDRFIPGFQIDFQLRTLYCRKAKEVLDSFNSYEIITGDLIKNISIQKDKKNKKERLYPDVLLSNPERHNFTILELKKDSQTEREAITELFAYAIEIKNQLPNIADSDINLVVVSTNFNTLLDHALSSLVLGTKFNILALKGSLDNGNLVLDVHIPDSWTDVWQNSLPEYALSSVSLVPYNYDDKKDIPDEAFLFDIVDDIITFNGAKNNSHGFFIIWKNITAFESPASFCISLYQINPFVFLQASIENNFTLNTNQPLSKYIIENYEDNIYSHAESLMNIGTEVKNFLDQYYSTSYEDFSSWTDHFQQGSNFRTQALPIIFNSWGNIGDYVRYYFFHPSLKKGFFSETQLNSPLYYKDPLFGIELINRISGNTLFENGVYDFTSLFKYAKQLRELLTISEWYYQAKLEDKKYELLQPRLYHATVDILPSYREIQYRLNYIKSDVVKPELFKINPFDVDENTLDSINKHINWFANEFLKNNPVHQVFFSKAINWCVLYMSDDIPIEDKFETEIKQQIIEYSKFHLLSALHSELMSKEPMFGDKLLEISSPFFSSIEELKKISSEDELISIIEAIGDDTIFSLFENQFLSVLDATYFEVFHDIVEFDNVSFITKDWKKLQNQLVKRFGEGYKYGAIIIDTNGNLAIGILPKEKQILKPIEDPYKEVYVLMNHSGIQLLKLVTWEEVKDGTAFINKKTSC